MTNSDDKTMRPGSPRFLGLALSVLLGGFPRTHAQEPQGFSSIPISLELDSRNVFWIDTNDAITFTLHADRRDLRLVFKDPKGMAWEIAAPSSGTEPALPQTAYGTTIERPVAGAWTLSVISSGPLLDYPITTLQITYANHIHARMSIPKQTFVIGESLPVSLELMDGMARVKNLRTTVTVTKLKDPTVLPTFVIFHDDGSNGDRIAKDGLYTAAIPTEAPGRFRLEAQIEGTASTGHFHRTFELTFKVVPKAAHITGNISQRLLVGTPD